MKSRSQPIVLSGYYGRGNFGDEAILSVLLSLLRPRFEVRVLSRAPEVTQAAHSVRAIPDSEGPRLSRYLQVASAGVLLYGGGGLLKYGGAIDSRVALLDPLVALMAGVPVAGVGLGADPIPEEPMRSWRSQIVSHFQFLWVRDEESARCLEVSSPHPPLRIHPDPVFAARAGDRSPRALTPDGRRPRVGIALSGDRLWEWLKKVPGRVETALEGLVRALTAADCQEVIHFISEDSPKSRDGMLGNEVLRYLPSGTLRRCVRLNGEDLQAAWNSLGALDCLISTRYHAALVAGQVGTPAFFLHFEDKTRALSRLLNLPGWDAHRGSASELEKSLYRFLLERGRPHGERSEAALLAVATELALEATEGLQALADWIDRPHPKIRVSARTSAFRSLMHVYYREALRSLPGGRRRAAREEPRWQEALAVVLSQ